MTTERPLLALDTATRMPTLVIATADGRVMGQRQWESQHRHGEQLLEQLNQLLAEVNVNRRQLSGVIVGTGPGSFTGLRIGLATAKTIAYGLAVPLTGVGSTVAIAHAAWLAEPSLDQVVVTLPAGASDRYEHRIDVGDSIPAELDGPQLVAGAVTDNGNLVAVDLIPPVVEQLAVDRGARALQRLGQALAELGSLRFLASAVDDPATLVPAYVALPRGIANATAEMTWSPDLH